MRQSVVWQAIIEDIKVQAYVDIKKISSEKMFSPQIGDVVESGNSDRGLQTWVAVDTNVFLCLGVIAKK